MLANMSEIDPRAGIPPMNESDVGLTELPTGTVTLLLADIEGSTRLWETQPREMAQAVARLDGALTELIAAHRGVRPVEQGEGDSFVVAFDRASDAVACALQLQLAPLAPIRLRIGLHTGEVQLRDEGNYIGPTINRTARLRDLGHGGQTVLSGATEEMVADHLPPDAWLLPLGSHQLRDLRRAERVIQLCHPDLHNQFPPLRLPAAVSVGLPPQLTSFVGRQEQIAELTRIIAENRLVTLTGPGGAGKTRLAVQVAGRIAADFRDGAHYVDLAPITESDLVPATTARTLGLTDIPGRSAGDALLRFITDRQMLLVLDNCEHLLDATAELVGPILRACPGVTVLTTSREPIGMTGEVIWRVSSLSITDEAVELFTDRARLVRPEFVINQDNAAAVEEICQRLDGMPLAIELAAARVRALSVTDILTSLHDRFRLLTGGNRTAVRRQQTLRASVDWSHALLTDVERLIFRRLAVFRGGFHLDAAEAVATDDQVQRHQVLDELTLLVDKSLVIAENISGRARYRLLETVRQYALERLGESGESDAVRARHRDHYTQLAVVLDQPNSAGRREQVEQAENEIDNLRAAFTWSCDTGDGNRALQLASALQPLWLTRGRVQEGLSWIKSVLSDGYSPQTGVAPAVYARALADHAVIAAAVGDPIGMEGAQRALAIAREVGESGPLLHALVACGCTAAYNPEVAGPYLDEAAGLARESGDKWRLSQILWWQSYAAICGGDPTAALRAGQEGRDLADEIGDRFLSRMCRFWGIATSHVMRGEPARANTEFNEIMAEAEADHDPLMRELCHCHLGHTLAWMGDTEAALEEASAALRAASEFGAMAEGMAGGPLALAQLAAGDVAAAVQTSEMAAQRISAQQGHTVVNANPIADVMLAHGDIAAARRWADAAVAVTAGCHLGLALNTRARVASAQGEPEQAERDAREALAIAASHDAHVITPDALECLAGLAAGAGSHREAARLYGAADAVRQSTGVMRFKVYDDAYTTAIDAVREALGPSEFESAWTEGAALSVQEAIAYARRGHGDRRRPTTGWGALTPTEHDVVRLVGEGLANNDIAKRLFISPRTVQSHLTHVYNKLGVSSRVQLVQEAARHH
ncbi:LuxR C-terminal-related transcriptional regulator [Mycobacterium sp. 050272]|uniref:LuxR C-terminal-related transcriptional regulator n=1 Tax=Mycobacterium sp. 050272 TaxID=3142488 RepID=UPI00318AB3C7